MPSMHEKHEAAAAQTTPSAEAIPFPGQWRLARVDVANWGTFTGFHSLPVSRKGLLITGDSGSGKSTLLDAISVVLTPPSNLSLNAAANSGGGRDRSISKYVRGAYSNTTDASGEVVPLYLREPRATWSGILLRYENGLASHLKATPATETIPSRRGRHEAINLLAVFFQKADSYDAQGLKRFYAVIKGDCRLANFECYGTQGADMGQFNRDYKGRGRAWSSHSHFAARLCSEFGIESAKTLLLLHKIQAAKNFGSLDELFRTYMLDEPATFSLADAAIEQFEELSQAHAGVVRQRQQMECLQPLETLDERHAAAETQIEAVRLQEQALPLFAEHVVLQGLQHTREKLLRRSDELRQLREQAEDEQRRAKEKLSAAQAILNERGGLVLENAKMAVNMAQLHLNAVQDSHASLARELSGIEGVSMPASLAEFEALRRTLENRAKAAHTMLAKQKDEKIDHYGEVKALKDAGESIQAELRCLRSARGNIPRELQQLRAQIARHLGIEPVDLPFFGELVDIRPEHTLWQGAIERVLRGQARTMLALRSYAPAINEFLEGRHLGLRFDYEAVPDEVKVPSLQALQTGELSLVRKVAVNDLARSESITRWVNKILRERFDYACVERPADLEKHRKALTKGGQVKNAERHTKDDRSRTDDVSRWILGSSNDRKIEALERELQEYRQKLLAAQKETEKVSERERKAYKLIDFNDSLRARQWSEYDLDGARRDLASAKAHRDTLAQSDDFREADQLCQEAQQRADAADKAYEKARFDEHDNEHAIATCSETIEKVSLRITQMSKNAPELSPDLRSQLDALLVSVDKSYRETSDSTRTATTQALSRLSNQASKLEQVKSQVVREAEKTMERYRSQWPAEAADLTSRFEDREGFLALLRQIRATDLPRFEHKFLDVLTGFSQDQLTGIASEIREAFREVRDRLIPVNHSLTLSEYAPGIHLRIEVTEKRSAAVKDFLAKLREITSGMWETDDISKAEQRFEQTASVMRRLASPEAVDITWRRQVLDTTRHMRFVAHEIAADGSTVNSHSSDGGLSGGQKQKLVFFCLAAALRYQLADEDQPIPSYGTVVLDEAFDKSDHRFAEEALSIFERFGFHMVFATPGKMLQLVEDHIGAIVAVGCEDQKSSYLAPVMFEAVNEMEE